MKRFSLLILSLILLIPVSAVTIPAGTYHFDNNVTHYSHVKFLYGQQTQGKTVIISLTQQADGLWTFTIPETVTGQSHYFFSDTSLPDGDYPMSVTSVKDDIAGKRGERRTQTFKDQDNTPMIPGATFVPNSTDQYTSGRWVTAVSSTQTLPALHIDTEGGVRITSKETYINATYYLEANGVEGVSDIATASEPLPMLIRGRGNYTWTGFDKKPYRIKLSASAPLAGMEKSKHFVLMAGADDNLAYMRNPLGYELSRRMGLAWTPDCRPIELYLNSKYEGLYFLTENIRVDKDRVNVTEQDDNATGDVTGGWLVEVDNYNTDPHISVNMPDKRQQMWITYHSPEILSAQQETYLQQQFDAIRDAIPPPPPPPSGRLSLTLSPWHASMSSGKSCRTRRDSMAVSICTRSVARIHVGWQALYGISAMHSASRQTPSYGTTPRLSVSSSTAYTASPVSRSLSVMSSAISTASPYLPFRRSLTPSLLPSVRQCQPIMPGGHHMALPMSTPRWQSSSVLWTRR